MRKSLILVLIASLIMGVLFVSCNSDVASDSSAGDKLVKVTIDGNSKGINAIGIKDNSENYYWYYMAAKSGGIYFTGQTSDWTPVKSERGLKGANLGYFSAGSWTFAFRAYSAEQTSSFSDTYTYYNSINVDLNQNKTLEVAMQYTSLPNALLVFPNDLNWVYIPDTTTDYSVTLTELGTRKAYMKVYAKQNTTETLIATSSLSNITVNTDVNTARATFSGFESDVRLASGEYTLVFKVFVTAHGSSEASETDQQVGEEKAESVTAYLGGKIDISKADSGQPAVEDNERGYHVIIDSVYNPASGASEATIAAAVIPSAPDNPTEDGENNSTYNTQASVATTITTSATAVEVEDTKKSTVSIPDAALAESKVTITKSGNDYTTKTESSTHTLSMQVETENVATTSTAFVISTGSAPVVGINLDMTKITTTTTQVNNNTPIQNVTEAQVTSFNDKYVTVSTYIEPGLVDVQVGYDGSGEQPIFKASETNPVVATASADGSSNDAGTGYNPTTGLLVFKTNHFSSFVVASKMVAQIGTVKYPTLQAAVDAVTEGQTVILIQDIDPIKTVVVNKTGVNFTLDFNGKTIANSADIWKGNDWSLISVQGTTNLTIVDSVGTGKLTAKEDDCYAVDICDGATLNIQGGEYNGNITAVYVYEGTLNISGGVFKIQQLYSGTGEEKYRFMINCLDANYKNGTSVVNISGGSFYNYNPKNNKAEGPETDFVVAGYTSVSEEISGDTVYTVIEMTYHEALAPTCTQEGHTAYYSYCHGNEEVNVGYETVPATGHTKSISPSYQNAFNGSWQHATTCSICGQWIVEYCVDDNDNNECDQCGHKMYIEVSNFADLCTDVRQGQYVGILSGSYKLMRDVALERPQYSNVYLNQYVTIDLNGYTLSNYPLNSPADAQFRSFGNQNATFVFTLKDSSDGKTGKFMSRFGDHFLYGGQNSGNNRLIIICEDDVKINTAYDYNGNEMNQFAYTGGYFIHNASKDIEIRGAHLIIGGIADVNSEYTVTFKNCIIESRQSSGSLQSGSGTIVYDNCTITTVQNSSGGNVLDSSSPQVVFKNGTTVNGVVK